MSDLSTTDGWLSQLKEGRRGRMRAEAVDPGALDLSALTGAPGASGWLCLADAIWRLDSGAWRWVSGTPASSKPPELALSQILSAELCLDDRTSLHLRRTGPALRAWRYTEGEGDEVILFDERRRATERGLSLRYAVAWRAEADPTSPTPDLPVWRPWVARFTGWSL